MHDVAKGTADDDAVNVAQLKEANTTVTSNNGSVGVVRTTKTDGHTNYDLNITDSLENIASIIGGETKYDGNKTIITNNIGDTGKNTIHEAIKAVDKNITVNGWNEANTTDGNLQLAWSDTNNTYDLSLNKDLNLTDGSITFGDSYIKNGEFVVANDGNKTTITPNGLVVNSDGKTLKFTDNNVSVGGNQIHDVAKGTADDDAVNVAQLKDVVEANITKVTVNGGVKAPDSGYTDGNLQLAWGGDSNNTYDLKLNKDLDLTGGSVKFGDNTYINATEYVIGTSDGNTTITSDGIVISKNSKNDIQITQSNISMGDNVIHDVGAGVDDTDAVNVSQLKKATEGNRTKFTIEGGVVAGTNGTYTGSNLLLTQGKDSEGNYTYDLKLADTIKIGGGSGQDGNITVADKNGNNGVSISVANGTGSIAINGDSGTSATITIGKGDNSLTKTNPTRIIYKDQDGNNMQVATLDDGVKYKGDYGSEIAKNLNQTQNIKGNHTGGENSLTNGNIGVVNDGSDLIVKLAKDIDLGQDGSVTIGNTVINNSGLTIGSGSNTIKITDNNISMGGQQIHDVAAGTADTDAVNVGQLKQVQTNVTNIQNDVTNITNIVGDPTGDKLKTYNVKDKTTYVPNTVVDAIQKMNSQGIKFFHTNDGSWEGQDPAITQGANSTDDASAGGKFSTAIGVLASVEKGADSGLAIGNGATVKENSKNSIAIGVGSTVNGSNSIAIGTGNKVLANNAGAFGDPNTVAAGADGSYVIGNNNNITTNDTFVIGNSSDPNTPKVTVANSLFFGNDAAYVDENTKGKNGKPVSKGNAKGYKDDEVKATNANGDEVIIGVKKFAGGDQVVGVVSVGNGSQTRRIQNVAPGLIGKDSTDAINGSQLYSALEGVAEHLGGQVAQTNQAVNNLANQLGEAKKEYRGGIASAIAIGNLPQSTIPGKGMLSVGTGYYKDQGSLSLGLSKMSDNGKWIFKSSLSYDTQENVGAGLSLGFHF
ncbi:YadA-like family protein [Campylobacter sp. CS_NA3]|uniref:YadA family autotransporter adhesin n=1 Tax=Campylobacter sp. CS_NA3 TaxID=2984142 RepID=UPI0022E9A202|nr:YadA-like family protein [Campylobacter sp. CS_NA3]WBR52026.1 YadA-like family protein [Campylobacter sp. CS_NA3]